MPNINIPEAAHALSSLIDVAGGGRIQQQGPGPNIPMSGDSTHAQPTLPSYSKMLESMVQNNALSNGNVVVRSQNGGYAPAPSNTGRMTKNEGSSAQAAPDLVVGLGLFNPRTFMKGSRDNGEEQGDDGNRGYSQIASQQVDALSQLMRAQQLYTQSQNPMRALLTPLRQDGVQFRGTAPPEVVNSFEELMFDLTHKLAESLNGAAASSGVASAKPGELLDSRPESLVANAANAQEMMHVLEDAISFHLLQQSASVAAEEKSAGMVEAAKIVLTTIVNKLQSGEIESNPETMKQIVEALHNVLENSPELLKTGIGERLDSMRTMLSRALENQMAGANDPAAAAAAPANPAVAAAPSEPAKIAKAPRTPESIGWTPISTKSNANGSAPQSLDSPRQFKKISSGSVSETGTARGTGVEDTDTDADADEFAFNLQPQKDGEMSIMTAYGNQNGDALFKVDAKMANDDKHRAVNIGEGRFSWNNGQDAIRLGARGSAEVSADGGESWSPLPNGENSRYVSADGRFDVHYNPVERTVHLEANNADGSRAGAATMAANGEGVSFKDLTARNAGQLG